MERAMKITERRLRNWSRLVAHCDNLTIAEQSALIGWALEARELLDECAWCRDPKCRHTDCVLVREMIQ